MMRFDGPAPSTLDGESMERLPKAVNQNVWLWFQLRI
jgi:hypothetical protein